MCARSSTKRTDEQQGVPENVFKALTEEGLQAQIKAGLTALNYTATRVLGNTHKTIRNLLRVCDGHMRVIAKVAFEHAASHRSGSRTQWNSKHDQLVL